MAVFWLIGGYGLIVLSYVFVWGIAATFSRCLPSQRLNPLTKTDLTTVVAMTVLWTTCWGMIQILEVIR